MPIWFLAGLVIANVLAGFTLHRAYQNKIQHLRVCRDRCRFALETAPNAFWDWNIATGEFYFSPGYFRLFGHPPKPPTNPYELYTKQVHPDDQEHTLNLIRQSIDQCKTSFTQEFRQSSLNGDYRYILLNGAVVEIDPRGHAVRIIAWLTDITDSHEMEIQHRQAAQKAELTTQLKNNILSTLSHEIRTPMNAISGLSHLVLQTDLDPQQQDLIRNIEESGRKLLDTINDIFEFSSLESGPILIDSRDFHLYEFFEPVVDFFHFREVEPDIDVLFDIDHAIPVALSGDALRAGQVLRHLCVMVLENSPKNQCVIKVVLHTQTDNNVVLEFSVSGIEPTAEVIPGGEDGKPGLAKETLNETKTGVGLSLTICSHIIDLMGGAFFTDSIESPDSRFRFELEFGIDKSPHIQSRYCCPASVIGARILVFEPERAVRKSLCDLLDSFGFKTMVCDSIDNARVISSEPRGQPFELIIVNGNILSEPDCEALTELKQFSLDSGLKIMVTLSGVDHTRYSDIDTEIRTGSRLIKPVSPSMLFKSVCRVLAREVQAEPDSLASVKQDQPAANILLVEDNRVNRQIAEELLDQLGTTVKVAKTGIDAINQIHSTDFDLVFMDIQMPEMDGIAATQSIRRHTRFENLPIIAMTAHATQRDREQALAAGMNDFISKPIDGMKLHRMLCRWLPWAEFNTITPFHSDEADPILYRNWSEINYAAGLLHVGQNALLYNRLLGQFYRDHHRDAEIINNALLNGDLETAHRLTHTLSGISANIAANALYTSAQTLNSAIQTQKRDDIRTQFIEFSGAYDRTMSELKAHPEIHSKLVAKPATSDTHRMSVEQLLSRMNTLLRQGDSEALDLIDEVEKSLQSFKLDSDIEELSSQLSYFLFEEARQTLTSIANSLDIELSE